LTSATLRQRAGDPKKLVFATDEEQRAEVIEQAKAYLATLDDIVINGKTYKILYFASDVDHVYDASRPILVDRQLTTFKNDQPPTTETILNRPLRAALLDLPEALRRPFDCHADSFSDWSHHCVVQMLRKSMTQRTRPGRGDKPGIARENVYLPILSIDSIHSEVDICFTDCGFKVGEYPFSEGGWREEGIPSRMVIRFCERQTESYDRPTACTIFHNGRKLYEHVPENPARQVVFSAQGAHCYFYKGCPPAARGQDLYSPPSSTLYACAKVRETFEQE